MPTQPYQKVSERLSIKRIMTNNFVGGLFWALGATLGLAIIFSVLTIISKNINLVPVVGSFVSDIIEFVISKNPRLQ